MVANRNNRKWSRKNGSLRNTVRKNYNEKRKNYNEKRKYNRSKTYNDYVSATSVGNYMLGDPCLDYIKMHKRKMIKELFY